jgi:hypothetical protein
MKEQLDEVPIRTAEDLLAKYQVAVTTDDSNVLETRRRDCLAAVHRLPSNEYRPFRTPTIATSRHFLVWYLVPFDGVTCISKAVRLRTNAG